MKNLKFLLHGTSTRISVMLTQKQLIKTIKTINQRTTCSTTTTMALIWRRMGQGGTQFSQVIVMVISRILRAILFKTLQYIMFCEEYYLLWQWKCDKSEMLYYNVYQCLTNFMSLEMFFALEYWFLSCQNIRGVSKYIEK